MTVSEATRAPPGPRRRANDRAARELTIAFLEALGTADRDAAERIARRALASGLSVAEVHALVIEPAMDRIGELWREGALDVGEEHLATAISQSVAAAIYPEALSEHPNSGGVVVLAAVEGERHAFGLRMAADLLEGKGHTVRLLGADVPLDSLLAAVERFTPDLVGLSISMGFNGPILREYLIALAELDVRVMVGGGEIPKDILDSGLLCIDNVLALPETIESVPLPGTWRQSIGAGDPALRQSLLHADAPTASGDFESSLADTATDLAELARAAMRERYLYERLATIDPVTELPNRRAWDERLEQSAAAGADTCIAMVDVDRFKEINDSLGHEGGDRALRQIGSVLSRELRPGDFIARFGGDEFAIVIKGVGPVEAAGIAERLRAAVERELEGRTTVSVGVAALDSEGRAGMIAADRALYAAKAGGRNRIATVS